MSILRDGTPMTRHRHAGASAARTGLLGIGIADETSSIKPGAVEAVAMSVQKNVQYAGLIFQTVWGLVTRETRRSS